MKNAIITFHDHPPTPQEVQDDELVTCVSAWAKAVWLDSGADLRAGWHDALRWFRIPDEIFESPAEQPAEPPKQHNPNLHTFSGWLSIHESEYHDWLYLGKHKLAEQLEDLFYGGRTVTVRFWITKTEVSKDEAMMDYITTVLGGQTSSKVGAHYSEYSGYLWTDEQLWVGGHDLIGTLREYIGHYCIVEIELHQKD